LTLCKPKAGFIFTIKNPGVLPDTVNFTSTSIGASTYSWCFDNGKKATIANPKGIYSLAMSYHVKLVVANLAGKDSITKVVVIISNKPVAGFNFKATNAQNLPVLVTCSNTSSGSNDTYSWSFGDGHTSTRRNPTNAYGSGGIYNIKLQVTNRAGTDTISKKIRISPYPQVYTDIDGAVLNLFAWEGANMMILSNSNNLNRTTMFKWLRAMDETYAFYKNCTGRAPESFAPTFIDNRSTIADVPATCGAGCSYIGFTGIEMLNTYFDIMYNGIDNNNQYDQVDFYEFGRNFWFYSPQLA
jgi:hypothetical protein